MGIRQRRSRGFQCQHIILLPLPLIILIIPLHCICHYCHGGDGDDDDDYSYDEIPPSLDPDYLTYLFSGCLWIYFCQKDDDRYPL